MFPRRKALLPSPLAAQSVLEVSQESLPSSRRPARGQRRPALGGIGLRPSRENEAGQEAAGPGQRAECCHQSFHELLLPVRGIQLAWRGDTRAPRRLGQSARPEAAGYGGTGGDLSERLINPYTLINRFSGPFRTRSEFFCWQCVASAPSHAGAAGLFQGSDGVGPDGGCLGLGCTAVRKGGPGLGPRASP